jgi:hypothetical protein
MASISPLVLEAGAIWAGNDGNWSTWPAQIGSPPQQFHILPSTSHGEVWIPGPQGCSGRSAPLNCASSRGVGSFQGSQSLGFLENASSTWEQIGIYEFIVGGDLFEATETGLYGQDAVALGSKGENVINNQTVAGTVTQDFWVSVKLYLVLKDIELTVNALFIARELWFRSCEVGFSGQERKPSQLARWDEECEPH